MQIRGLDCGNKKNPNKEVVFNYYKVIYRRAVLDKNTSTKKYLKSINYTILTMYPTEDKNIQWEEEDY